MKKLLLPIFACLMLAAPSIHAGLDSWISSIVPQSMRASEETRTHVYTATQIMRTPQPVIVTRARLNQDPNADEKTLACTDNYGFFSHIRVDENEAAKNSSSENIHTLYHESAHARHNHTVDPIVPYYASHILLDTCIMFSPITCFLHMRGFNRVSHFAAAAGILSGLGHHYAKNKIPHYSHDELMAIRRTQELEADTLAAQSLACAGHRTILEQQLDNAQQSAQRNGIQYRPNSEEHPTLGQEIAYITAALDQNMC